MSLWRSLKIYGRCLGLVDRTTYICQQAANKVVLHVGCADYPITTERIKSGKLLHAELSRVSSECIGIDSSEEGIETLRSQGITNVRVLNAENISDLKRKFDLIVAADVLEHMTSPSIFLKSIRECLQNFGELLISVPNAYSLKVLQYFVKGIEMTHYEHCFYFSVKTLSELCCRCELVPVELAFTSQLTDAGDSKLFLFFRKTLLTLKPKMAPYIIMKFRRSGDIKRDRVYIYY